ncbi:hypothetical protein SDC9_159448 [bioreactor metagenome]|uniref:Uncharacterized protein n=1 Tax=bioreactor metagenome TaxID=1076179 RepID=A0A645FEW0_9ZZZZ|nr:serine/threonine protein kinase [Oscillospiraceae bacterium]
MNNDILTNLIFPIIVAACVAFFSYVSSKRQKEYEKQTAELKKKFEAKEKAAEEREKRQEEFMVLLVKMGGASLALGEANSIALQSGKCNGETHKALEYAQQVKHENKDFLTSMGVKSIFETIGG